VPDLGCRGFQSVVVNRLGVQVGQIRQPGDNERAKKKNLQRFVRRRPAARRVHRGRFTVIVRQRTGSKNIGIGHTRFYLLDGKAEILRIKDNSGNWGRQAQKDERDKEMRHGKAK
jgi:hypothetical protein